MCILMFIPLTLIAAIAERPRRSKPRQPFRKRHGREVHLGRSY